MYVFQSHLRVLFPAGLNAVMLPMLRKKYTFRIMQKATCTSATDPNSVLDADLLTPAFLKCSSAKKVSKRDGGKDTKSVRKRVTEMFYDNNNNSNNNHYCNSNNNYHIATTATATTTTIARAVMPTENGASLTKIQPNKDARQKRGETY